MGVDSIVGGSVGKLGGNRGKGVITPAAKFPLRVHKGTGYWCKKINGQVAYFGKVADDPEGVAALEEYRALLNGRAAGGQPGLTMNALSGKFLDHHEELMASGKRSARSFQCLK